MAKPEYGRVEFHFREGDFSLTELEIKVLEALKLNADGRTSFAEIADDIGGPVTSDDVLRAVINMQNEGVFEIVWPPELVKLLAH